MTRSDGTYDAPPTDRGVAASDIVGAVRRHWPLFAAVVAVVTVVAVVAALLAPTRYSATASVAVSPVSIAPFASTRLSDQVNMQTEAAIATSRAVSTEAARALDGAATADELRDATTVAVPSQSLILRITATSSRSAWSVDAANAMARAYLADRQRNASAAAARITRTIDTQITQLRRERAGSVGEDASFIDTEIVRLSGEKTQLQRVALNPGRIVTLAESPARRSTPARWTMVLAGVVGGALLGLLAVLVLPRLEPRVRRPLDAAAILDAPAVSSDAGGWERELRDALTSVLANGRSAGRGRRSGPRGPVTLAVVAVAAPERAADVVDRLVRIADDEDLRVRWVRATMRNLAPEGGDDPKWDLLIIDACSSATQLQATLARQCDATFAIVEAGSSKGRVRALADAAAATRARVDIVLFLDHPSRSGGAANVDHAVASVEDDPADDMARDTTDRARADVLDRSGGSDVDEGVGPSETASVTADDGDEDDEPDGSAISDDAAETGTASDATATDDDADGGVSPSDNPTRKPANRRRRSRGGQSGRRR